MSSTLKNVTYKARGVIPAVFTPMNNDNTVNVKVIPKYAEYLTKNGVTGVLVGGTASQHMCLSVIDRKRVIEEWVKASKGKLHIMAQVGGAPMADVLDLTQHYSGIGVDSILTLPELYFRPNDVTDLVDYVVEVAKLAPNLPILYYHAPHMTNVSVHMPTFAKAASDRIPNFKGIKFASTDLKEAEQLLRVLKDDQDILIAYAEVLAPAALMGIKSTTANVYNFLPHLARDILEAVNKQEMENARSLQSKLTSAIEAHIPEGAWVAVMRAGTEIVSGIELGPPLRPVKPITDESKQRIKQRLTDMGII
ncbi:N-acetylneuraminate lyase-like isoform X2 [Leptidea sinapis]|uniref:N-acetylneuraminate lyase-like isoform X2 n=1 Tax=Leptidea sinapis TaxID=189913 RepID=UPI0021C40108|nr:N-acetylneuraminate lyase-like isoform X2 [Leptidea sinapis]